MKYEDALKYMDSRVIELQPILRDYAQDLRALGKTEEEIHLDMCFSLIHEGFRIRDMIPTPLTYGDVDDKLPE
jgi:hypothetical protein